MDGIARRSLVALAVVALIAGGAWAQCAKCNAVSDDPGFKGDVGSWNPDAPAGLTLLQWDDGSFETGFGVNSNAAFDGQIATRFGGSPATTGAVPMGIRGAYWRMYPGFGGATNVNINFFHPLAGNGFPTGGPILQVAGNTATNATQFASTPAGPTINTANGSVLVGVGVLGNASWFVAGDLNGAQANRHFFGAGTNQTTVIDYGPPTLNAYSITENFLIRMLVDGGVPVELQAFDIE